MSALPGTPAIQNAIPMPFFGTTPFAAPGLGIVASLVMLGFGMWWLLRAQAAARDAGEGYGGSDGPNPQVSDEYIRERAAVAREFDPAEVYAASTARLAPPSRWLCCRWRSSSASISQCLSWSCRRSTCPFSPRR